MSAQPQRPFVTPAEYLAIERAADYKSEYFAGEMFAMAGASDPHETIVVNLTREVSNELRGSKPCRPKGGNLRVRVRLSNYLYPDMTIVCGKPDYDDDAYLDTLINPTVIFEILSESTEHKDRGIKWKLYQQIASLQHYVLISQEEPVVEVYTKTPDGDWLMHVERGMDGNLRLPAVDISLPLSGLYEDITFPASETENPS